MVHPEYRKMVRSKGKVYDLDETVQHIYSMFYNAKIIDADVKDMMISEIIVLMYQRRLNDTYTMYDSILQEFTDVDTWLERYGMVTFADWAELHDQQGTIVEVTSLAPEDDHPTETRVVMEDAVENIGQDEISDPEGIGCHLSPDGHLLREMIRDWDVEETISES